MLSFKKLRLFIDTIEILRVRYCVEGYIYILSNRIAKIAAFLIPLNQSEVRVFLSIIDITRK